MDECLDWLIQMTHLWFMKTPMNCPINHANTTLFTQWTHAVCFLLREKGEKNVLNSINAVVNICKDSIWDETLSFCASLYVISVIYSYSSKLFFFPLSNTDKRTCGTAVVVISLVQLVKEKYGFDLGLPEFRDSEAQH